jgi:hypothetical protein
MLADPDHFVPVLEKNFRFDFGIELFFRSDYGIALFSCLIMVLHFLPV